MLNPNELTKTEPKPKPANNIKHCSHVCPCRRVQLSCTTRHRTVLILFPLILQTFIIAQMMSIGGHGKMSIGDS